MAITNQSANPTCTAREHFLWRLTPSYPTRNEGTSVSMTKSVDKTHIGVQSYPHSVGGFYTKYLVHPKLGIFLKCCAMGYQKSSHGVPFNLRNQLFWRPQCEAILVYCSSRNLVVHHQQRYRQIRDDEQHIWYEYMTWSSENICSAKFDVCQIFYPLKLP